jgi:hypothetical protein
MEDKVKIEVDSEPKLPVTDVENSAVKELLTLNPKLLEGAEAHAARVMPPVVAPPKMTPEEVQSEIDRLCGRSPIDPGTERDNRDAEVSRKAEEYRQAVAKREQDDATARMREIFNACQPTPETGK